MQIKKLCKECFDYIFNKKTRFSINTKLGFYNNQSDEKYLKRAYKLFYGCELNLENPQTFDEKLQYLKLHDRNPFYTKIVDKYEVKQYISDTIGQEYVIKTYGVYNNFDEIDFNTLPDKFVLKTTHNSGGVAICKDKATFNKKAIRRKLNAKLKQNYYMRCREWPYKDVPPRIIAEEYLLLPPPSNLNNEANSIDPDELQSKIGILDYKFLCFNGKVEYLFLDIGVIDGSYGHAEEYYRNVYDTNFTLMPWKETRENYPVNIKKPDNFDTMLKLAAQLSKGFPHVRVDMYNLNGKIKIGELTLYHGAGLFNEFKPQEWGKTLGDKIDLSLCYDNEDSNRK